MSGARKYPSEIRLLLNLDLVECAVEFKKSLI